MKPHRLLRIVAVLAGVWAPTVQAQTEPEPAPTGAPAQAAPPAETAPAEASAPADIFGRLVTELGDPAIGGPEQALLHARDVMGLLAGRWVAIPWTEAGPFFQSAETLQQLCSERAITIAPSTDELFSLVIRDEGDEPRQTVAWLGGNIYQVRLDSAWALKYLARSDAAIAAAGQDTRLMGELRPNLVPQTFSVTPRSTDVVVFQPHDPRAFTLVYLRCS